jgi:hypothetical protein
MPSEHAPHNGLCDRVAETVTEAEKAAAKILQEKMPKESTCVLLVLGQAGACGSGGVAGDLAPEKGHGDNNESALLVYVIEWASARLLEIRLERGEVKFDDAPEVGKSN